jgi:hypothetical protein
MASTDFSRVPATQAPRSISKYLDPTEEVVFHRRFHWAVLLEPITVVAAGLAVTSFAAVAVHSTGAERSREVLVGLWILWAAWALTTIWDYKTLTNFYKGSSVAQLFAIIVTAGAVALAGYVGKTKGVATLLWYSFFVFCLWALLQAIRYGNRYLILTNKRLMVVEGIVNQQVKSLPLPKLTDMIYQRTALGQALGYGTFDLQVPGAAVNLGKIPYVGSPDNTYLQISHLLWGAAGPPKPKKIALSGQLVEPTRPGEAATAAPRNISITGEMDG